MKPQEFTSFKKELPDKNVWIIVTNKIGSYNAYGEMSHVWLVNFYTTEIDNSFISYENNSKIDGLTHWKYA